jgi:hypothetical protein
VLEWFIFESQVGCAVRIKLTSVLVASFCLACDGGDNGPVDQDPSDIQIFPADNPWNTPVDNLPVHPLSDQYVASIGAGTGLHADFGADPAFGNENGFGIPFVVVESGQPLADVSFEFADESDPGPYPIPEDAPIEAGGDRHVLVVDRDARLLYEVFAAEHIGPFQWTGGSGAIFDLTSNALRPDFFTSADAAGLPIFPGLVRVDEVLDKGEINHALRFTVSSSQRGFIHPATHFASNDTDPNLPPMGLRFRLKADFDITPFSPDLQVILIALKRFGMIVADNGSDWFISGAPSPRWNDETIGEIREVLGSDFEAVDTGPIITD